MQKSPTLKSSGLAPIADEPVHVFGKNLEERVVESRGDENKDEGVEGGSAAERPAKEEEEDDIETVKKRKFDAITGEESEETIFQGDFKLFSWDRDTSNWIEKGRGQLKLNDLVDPKEKRSRLIMRTGGTYRIILNVAMKRSFFKVISNTKTSIRFTDSINVWAASGSNAGQLTDLIKERLLGADEEQDTNHVKKSNVEHDDKHDEENNEENDEADDEENDEEPDDKSDEESDENSDDEPHKESDEEHDAKSDKQQHESTSEPDKIDKSDEEETGTKRLKPSSD